MIAVAQDGPLWTITLNRPEKANALTPAMLADLESAVAGAAKGGAKALILTGAGRVFSAGADLEEARAGLATDPVWERLSGAIAALPCLTICALNGTVAGGAMGVALACDLRLAVPGAAFFYPVMRLGFLPQPSDVARLRALTGPARTKAILLAGAKVTADEALVWGLVERLVPPELLLTEAALLARDALAADAAHLSAIKRMTGQGRDPKS
ncbi:enoyl-CoA hydratase/isomerase family protein [Fertoebacter nigrum]|uniref:Enoyl-CoA hydratase/isomerase family protein n=1 Tax=Fertoeibacter niger TaxID=2656921 RepID=A0A8X8KQU3_9RHOB|nr:enoyl-CoA hydratase/isomerase family protein [Fertoeibacter niger]NUB46341.1 enoyl-CoA hydratase/isomerase family protein [Fertoeibacter niger]